MASRGNLLQYVLWVLIARIANVLALTVISVIAARWLPKDDFGGFATILVTTYFWSLISAFGLDQAALREIGKSRASKSNRLRSDLVSNALRTLVIAQLIAAAGCSAFFYYSGYRVLGYQPSGAFLASLTLVALLRGLLQVSGEVSRALGDQFSANMLGGHNGGPFTLALWAVGVGLLRRWGVVDLRSVVLILLGSLVLTLIWISIRLRNSLYLYVNDEHSSHSDISAIRGELGQGLNRFIFGTSLPLTVVAVLTFSATRIDLFLVSICFDNQAVALYEAASKLALLVALPLAITNLVVVRQISTMLSASRSEDLQDLLQGSCLVTTLVASFAGLVLLLFPDQCVSVVFSPDFIHASPIIRILVVGQIIFVATGTCGLTLLQSGFTRLAVVSIAAGALLNVGLGLILAKPFGAVGIAFASAVSLAVTNLLNWYFAGRFAGIWTHPSAIALVRLLRAKAHSDPRAT